MRLRSLACLSALILTGAACAYSSPVQERGAGGASHGASSTGGGSSSSSSSTGDASSSSSSSGGPIGPCGESPCKLTGPQCGCAGGQQCSTDPASLDPTYRVCVPQGIQGEGQKCVNGTGCGPGLICAQKSPTLSTCATFCAADADCKPPSGLCLLTLNDGKAGNIPKATLCTESCDPIGSAECVKELACRIDTEATGLLRSYTRCLVPGVGTQKSPCKANDECAAGYTCVTTGASGCSRYCKVGGNDCTAPLKCTALQANGKDVVISGTAYGACL
jgi:hypothetical protein